MDVVTGGGGFSILYSIFFNRQREKIWMIATGGQLLETLNVFCFLVKGPSIAWPSIVPRTRKIMSSHVPQAYSTCRAPIPKHARGFMNIHRQQKEYGRLAENGFSVCPPFFHTAYTSKYLNLFLSLCLYDASPLKIGSRLPCP